MTSPTVDHTEEVIIKRVEGAGTRMGTKPSGETITNGRAMTSTEKQDDQIPIPSTPGIRDLH